jgi:hypothetical protein
MFASASVESTGLAHPLKAKANSKNNAAVTALIPATVSNTVFLGIILSLSIPPFIL